MVQVPNLDYSSTSAIKYLVVKDLKKRNANSEITINYKNLDPETKGQLKTTIDHRIQYWLDKKSYLNNSVVEYLNKLFKANQGYTITIEYNKLVNDIEDDTLFEIVYKSHTEKTTVTGDFRSHIQQVLNKRSQKLYNNMILNPGV